MDEFLTGYSKAGICFFIIFSILRFRFSVPQKIITRLKNVFLIFPGSDDEGYQRMQLWLLSWVLFGEISKLVLLLTDGASKVNGVILFAATLISFSSIFWVYPILKIPYFKTNTNFLAIKKYLPMLEEEYNIRFKKKKINNLFVYKDENYSLVLEFKFGDWYILFGPNYAAKRTYKIYARYFTAFEVINIPLGLDESYSRQNFIFSNSYDVIKFQMNLLTTYCGDFLKGDFSLWNEVISKMEMRQVDHILTLRKNN